jgi:alanine racemase
MPRATTLAIDLSAIGDNIAALKRALGNRRFMAVVKADAYGHGAPAVAEHIEDLVDAFAVAFTEEAVALRNAGVGKPILILEGPHSAADVTLAAEENLWLALHEHSQVEWCLPHGDALSRLWVKIDTGMHRLGFSTEQLPTVRRLLEDAGCSRLTLMSHLASAELPESPLTQRQLSRWRDIVSDWPYEMSLSNSAASRLGLAVQDTWGRLGYAMYGGLITGLASNSGLKPAMQFQTTVLSLRQVAAGESVGYGGHWTAQRDSLIATLPAGYGDGYPWSAQNGTPVGVNGQKVPLVGRVSMDMLTIDVTDCDAVEIGTTAILWGQDPGIDEVAEACGTIGYELMTRMTGRATRCHQK